MVKINKQIYHLRIITDHVKSVTMLISDGVQPSVMKVEDMYLEDF